MSTKTEMSLGVSLLMSEITEKLLYTTEEREGQKVLVDRDIPFRLRYRLNKNRVMFDRDVQFFNKQKLLYLAQYGEPSDDGRNVVIKDEHKLELYREAISNLVDSKVEHNIMTLEPEDLELIEDTDIPISPDAMTLFIGYMTNDPDLEKDLATEIRINPRPVEDKPAIKVNPEKVGVEQTEPEKSVEKKPKASRKTSTKKTTEDGAEKPKKTKTQKKLENIPEGKPIFDDVPTGEVVAKPKKTTRKKKTEVANEQ